MKFPLENGSDVITALVIFIFDTQRQDCVSRLVQCVTYVAAAAAANREDKILS